METIDVTKIEPRFKHPTIFDRFDLLPEGASFVIHNDHDPKPLYYQMIAERGQVFEWEYLTSGPEIWEVKITRLKAGENPKTIGELVASDYRKAEIFRKFGLDFCCGGNKSIKQACEEKGINSNEVEAELKAIEDSPASNDENFLSWDLDFLSDYIVNKHHKYVTDSLPMLYEFSEKVARVHGDRHPEVVEIAHYFDAVAQELRMHMHKEEVILFPYIKELAVAKRENKTMDRPPFGSIENPIHMMEAEHESAGGNMHEVSRLSNRFTPPHDACASYRVLFAKLEEFEKDLHRHIHLENNILFPRAIEMEKTMF